MLLARVQALPRRAGLAPPWATRTPSAFLLPTIFIPQPTLESLSGLPCPQPQQSRIFLPKVPDTFQGPSLPSLKLGKDEGYHTSTPLPTFLPAPYSTGES